MTNKNKYREALHAWNVYLLLQWKWLKVVPVARIND